MAEIDPKKEREKMVLINNFLVGDNKLYFGLRNIFDKSEFREVQTKGRFLISFLEGKLLNKSQALLNFGFNIRHVNTLNFINRVNFVDQSIKYYMDLIKKDANFSSVKFYTSLHSVLVYYYQNFLDNNFKPIINPTIIRQMKLPIDGVHISLTI